MVNRPLGVAAAPVTWMRSARKSATGQPVFDRRQRKCSKAAGTFLARPDPEELDVLADRAVTWLPALAAAVLSRIAVRPTFLAFARNHIGVEFGRPLPSSEFCDCDFSGRFLLSASHRVELKRERDEPGAAVSCSATRNQRLIVSETLAIRNQDFQCLVSFDLSHWNVRKEPVLSSSNGRPGDSPFRQRSCSLMTISLVFQQFLKVCQDHGRGIASHGPGTLFDNKPIERLFFLSATK